MSVAVAQVAYKAQSKRLSPECMRCSLRQPFTLGVQSTCPNSTLLNETETLVCLWPLQLSCVEEGGLESVTMQVSTM